MGLNLSELTNKNWNLDIFEHILQLNNIKKDYIVFSTTNALPKITFITKNTVCADK